MAKYTETLLEYIDGGGALPSSSFDLIEGFERIFVQRYAGLEIGFETEALFANALEARAAIVMPIYAERITAANGTLTKLKLGARTRYERRAYGAMSSSNETSGSNTELPYNATNATPSSTSSMQGSATTAAHSDSIDFGEDFSADEQLRILDAMNRNTFLQVEACLNEFKNLFMGVY